MKIFILDVFLGDDGIPPLMFYNNLREVAKQITLEEAQAAISALPDSDVDDDTDEDLDGVQGDENDIQLSQLSGKSNDGRKKEKKDVSWKRRTYVVPNTDFSPGNKENNYVQQTPLMYFLKYFPDEVFVELTEKTNMYSIAKHGRNIATSVDEIKRFVAIHILMGVIRFPRLRMYWAPATRIQFMNNINISRNRFESLRNNLHIVDINNNNSNDKLWKVRPIIHSFEKRCEELSIEENLCIDESIIPFKGKLVIKQYIKGKPNPWGVKVFMLCGASGIIYRSLVYQGSTTLPAHLQEQYTPTNGLVMHLAERIVKHRGHKLFCDNYFTSLQVLQELREQGIFVAGTIRSNRLQKCPLKTEKEFLKNWARLL